MVFSSVQAYLDPSNWQQQQRQQEEAPDNNYQQSGGGGEGGGGGVAGTEAGARAVAGTEAGTGVVVVAETGNTGAAGAEAERGTIHSSTFTNPEEVVLFPSVTPVLQPTHYQMRYRTPTPTVLTHYHHQPSSIRPGSMAERARLANIPMPEASLKCPRCDSNNTKFCYFNNYNLSQPRHFCKTCRRYWTRGGALRNVPVGGGCRRRNNSNKQKSSSTTSCKGGSTLISSSTTSALLGAGRRGGGCSTTSLISTSTSCSSSSSTSISDQCHHINIHGLNSVSPMSMPMHSSNLSFFSSNYMSSPNNFNQYNFSSEFAELGLTGGSSSSTYGGHDGGGEGDHHQEITKPGTYNNNNNNNVTGSHMSGMRPAPQFSFPFPFTLLGGGGGGGGVCMDLEGSSFQGIGVEVGSPSNKILMLDSGGGADHDDQVIVSKTSDEFINGVQSFGNH